MKEGPLELSPDARGLFRAAREGALPSAADRARSMERLSAFSSDGSVHAASVPSLARAKRTPVARFGTKALLVAALVFATAASVAAVRHFRAEPRAPSTTSTLEVAAKPVAARRATAPAASTEVEVRDSVPVASAETAANVDHGARLAPPPVLSQKGDLGEDLALLGKARQSLARHQSAEALRLLAEDGQRFPSSPLREERAYTRIRALCDLGRATDAHAEAERFLRQWPSSVYATGVRRACSSASSGAGANDSLTGSLSSGH